MGVPAEILNVERPKNTIVDDSGRDTELRYSVRVRNGSKCIPGKNPQPRNGKVIGHIINYKFVPVESKTSVKGPDMLSYGSSALFKSLSEDIFDDLLKVYPPNDVVKIMAIAALKIIHPSVTASRMSTHYKLSFLCKYYPGAALSHTTICNFLQLLGQDGEKRRKFYQLRMASVANDHHIIIDGTLKQDNSCVNDLSAFTAKYRVKGCQSISILYAYDLEKMEPLCAEVFPGNYIDASAYRSFIRDNDIQRGIIVADKGFPPSQIKAELESHPNLHFLTPLKRNDTRIRDNQMLDFEGPLMGVGSHILYKKSMIRGGRFLYAYQNPYLAAAESSSFIARAEKSGNYDKEVYKKKKDSFGTIVLESDLDLTPETAFYCYEDRWELELVFKQYKSDICNNKTSVQNDFSVIGSEFINFISTTVECRIRRKVRETELLKSMTFGDLIEDLNSAWRQVDAPCPAKSDDGYWLHTRLGPFAEMEALGLSEPPPKPEPKKRGRPKKEPTEPVPKRPRGRPRKNS